MSYCVGMKELPIILGVPRENRSEVSHCVWCLSEFLGELFWGGTMSLWSHLSESHPNQYVLYFKAFLIKTDEKQRGTLSLQSRLWWPVSVLKRAKRVHRAPKPGRACHEDSAPIERRHCLYLKDTTPLTPVPNQGQLTHTSSNIEHWAFPPFSGEALIGCDIF